MFLFAMIMKFIYNFFSSNKKRKLPKKLKEKQIQYIDPYYRNGWWIYQIGDTYYLKYINMSEL